MATRREENFASASLVALVIRAAAKADPALVPHGIRAPDPMRDARISASGKRELLQHIYERRGAGPLLSIGRHLGDAAASPVLAVLANAGRPDIFVAKWLRLERYGHAANRTEIVIESDRALNCRRYSQGDPPTPAENALIAGFLFGLCGLAGARGRRLDIDGRRFDARSVAAAGPLAGDGARFRIAWKEWNPDPHPSPDTAASEPLADRLKTFLATDVARNWSLGEAAGQLAKSPRSLQRELGAQGLTFSTVLRGVRIDEAARLLRAGAASLAEIGYCCGYADQPHFQRDFRRALNMSPGDYRRVALD